jgi:hypothetical protein
MKVYHKNLKKHFFSIHLGFPSFEFFELHLVRFQFLTMFYACTIAKF